MLQLKLGSSCPSEVASECIHVLQCVVVCGGVLRCVVVHCDVLQFVVVCCSALQCVEVASEYI